MNQSIYHFNSSEWSVTTIASPAEDDIDFNDGSTVALTIECDDGSNPPLTGTFTVTLEDSVRNSLELLFYDGKI